MGKRKFYISMVLTVGSLAWTMYTLPGTIEQVDAAKPGSHALLTGAHARDAKTRSNAFETLPDIDAILDVARNNARAKRAADAGDDENGLTLYAAQPDLYPEDQRALLGKSHRHSPSKKIAHAGGR